MKIAIIDLGTNTCNLLIAEMNSPGYRILHQSKRLVKLGDDKIKANEISPEATKRSIQAFKSFKKTINNNKVDKVRILATSAVRSSENKIEYLEKISNETGWIVKVITGEKEAELIFNGVLLALGKFNEPSVILDIGGGSNELILAHQKKLISKESRPTGMARILNQFKISDPIKVNEVEAIQNYFSEEHKNTFEHSRAHSVQTLIGCSGAFDTIADIIDGVSPGEKQRITQELPISDFYNVFEVLVKSTREQRLKMKGMDWVRVDLIVPAVLLIEKLISAVGIKKIIQTDFALREGTLFEMMNFQ